MNPTRTLRWIAPGLALGVTAVLAWIACRGIPRTGFDQHYYLECVKVFRTHLPRSFGTGWPYGYPLLGAAVSRTGLSAYHSLLVVLACGLFAIYWLLWPVVLRALADPRLAVAALCSFAATAILPIEFGGVRSEIAFTAFYLAAVLALAGWPKRPSVALAVAAAVISFSLRYVGVMALFVLAGWLIHRWRDFPGSKRRLAAMLAILAGFAICAGLLGWNHRVTGHFAGSERGFGHGLADLAPGIADFGWGVAAALASIGVRHPFVAHEELYRLIGWSLSAGLLGFVCWRWLRPVSSWSRPLALGLAVYGAGMVALHSYDGFDPLYSPRFFLPALPLFFALVCETVSSRPRGGAIVLAVVFAAPGIAVCARGVSPELFPNFSQGVSEIQPRLQSDDGVGVNVPAFDLSAWLDCPVGQIDSPRAPDAFQSYRFAVLAAKATDRSASHYIWSPDVLQLIGRMKSGGYAEIGRWPGYVVFERIRP